jgi:hypothetical protein
MPRAAATRQIGLRMFRCNQLKVYTNPLQGEPDSVVGFTVNLAWVRESYFGDLLLDCRSVENHHSDMNGAS